MDEVKKYKSDFFASVDSKRPKKVPFLFEVCLEAAKTTKKVFLKRQK